MFRSLSWTPRIIHSFKASSSSPSFSSTACSPIFTSFSLSSSSSSLSTASRSSSFSTFTKRISLSATKAHQHRHPKVLSTLTSSVKQQPFSTTSKLAMRIIPVPVLEDNYAYILFDENTSEAAVVDPVEPQKLLHIIQHLNAKLTSVLITHHHWDHTNGNVELLAKKPGLAVFGADARIPEINYVVKDKEEFKVGSLTVQALWTPCHTKGSVCFFIKEGNDCAVFTGDTLFLSGCGRFFEGTAAEMYNSLLHVLATLPVETKVYCGHEYTKANLKFANHIEPDNVHVAQKLKWAMDENVKSTIPGTIGEELLANPFLRVNEPSLQAFTGKTDPIDVMHALRELKNNFK